MFGLTLLTQDLWVFFFVISGMSFLLFFITSLLGRLWCGWACPNTVFLDHVFRQIERWIDGDATARRRLEEAPSSARETIKRLTGALYFCFAWFREQFCINLYAGLRIIVLAALVTTTSFKVKPIFAEVSLMCGAPFFVDPGAVKNHYRIRLQNKCNQPLKFQLTLEDVHTGFTLSGLGESITLGAHDEASLPVIVVNELDYHKDPTPTKSVYPWLYVIGAFLILTAAGTSLILVASKHIPEKIEITTGK